MPAWHPPGPAGRERIGARFEGVRRAHVPATDGTVRDSAYFSIMADERPAARETLEKRLTEPTSLP